MSEEPQWVLVQQKTFTKWMNNHLRKAGFEPIENAQEDFETGIKLMQLINALYDVPIPKHNTAPRMRPHKLDNLTLALRMVEEAQVKTNFLKTTHLVDKDLKMILGMIWAIILDFQIKGISVEEMTAKEGLLLWCQKKTAGYRDVKVENFTTSWTSGLAFCALIHRHRPDLLDYDSLEKENASQNLELAFSVAENELGIPRLLDVEDIVNVARPDERSIMTYVSEYFHCFAGQDLKEVAARRIQKFVQFNKTMEEMEAQYEAEAQELLSWISTTTDRMSTQNFGDSKQEATDKFEELKSYLSSEKPPRAAQKLDLEALFVNIQTKLNVYGRQGYNAPSGCTTTDIDASWENLERVEKEYGRAVRDNMFRFITKSKTSISDEQLQEFEASFRHFDKDNSGLLDKIEFKAALSALSIPFKDEQAFLKVFHGASEGNDKITKDQWLNYLIELNEDKDTPEQIKSSFSILSDQADTITTTQLKVHPLTDGEIGYLESKMPAAGESKFNYHDYTDSCFSQ